MSCNLDVYLIGERTPRVDIHNLGRVARTLVRRHGLTHRHRIYEVELFRRWVVGVDAVVLIDRHLRVTLTVEGIEVVTVTSTVDVAIDIAAKYIDVGTAATKVNKLLGCCIQTDIYIA